MAEEIKHTQELASSTKDVSAVNESTSLLHETSSSIVTNRAETTQAAVAETKPNPFPLISQFIVKQTDISNIDLDALPEEERAALKVKLEEECLTICNCYLEVLAFVERWEKFDEIRIANDEDLDDLFDEDNGKFKSKLRVVALICIGTGLAYYFEQTWIWILFQALAFGPHVMDILKPKENFDTIVIPNKDSYFGQSFVSLGFKVQGKPIMAEKNKSLQPQAIELYNYFKHSLAIIRSLGKPPVAKKLKK